MLLILLMSAALEIVLKRLLYQDLAMSAIYKNLKGKILRFEFAEWKTPIILVFNERQVDILNVWNDIADCTVRIRLITLPALLARQRIIQLIKHGLLDIEGDLQCIQQFVTLLDMAEFDTAELLVPLVGDIAAESIIQANIRWITKAKRLLRTEQEQIAKAITDEWRLTPSSLELAWFCDEVNNTTKIGKNLAARLDKLEDSR